ncbi:TPA: hypothetical protein ACS7WR_003736 [Providencia alcalifaciens]
MLATGPSGLMGVVPIPNGSWLLHPSINGGIFLGVDQLPGNGTGSVSATLVNGDPWDALPGNYSLTMNVGTYSN